MSESEWNALTVGDIVMERRSKTPRIVLGVTRYRFKQGPRAGQPYVILLLRMLRRSWRANCNVTVLLPADWRYRLALVGHGARVTRAMRWCPCHGYWHFRRELRTPGGNEGSDKET